MESTQQSRYYQVSGAYPVVEDEDEEDPYLQMMNEIAEEEFNFGLRQSQYSHASGFSGQQHQYAGQNTPKQRSSYQMSASEQQEYAPKTLSARRPSHQKPVDHQNRYIRPKEPTLASNYQTSAYESHRMMPIGPIRHGRSIPISYSSTYSQPRSSNKDASAQKYFSKSSEGHTRPDRSAYEMRDSDFSERRPMTAPIGLEQHEIQSSPKEVEEPKKSKDKRASQAQGSKEEKKPAKSKVRCQNRFKNGRLECRIDYGAPGRKWEPAVRMDDCRRSLIDQQNDLAAQLDMEYYDPDPVGTGVDDETAFKLEHADWGPDREHLPEVCWRFKEDEKNNPRPSNNPGYMRFEGMVVLDSHDDPVKDWPQLPLTLSSKTQGYRLEAMSRENPHLVYRDFIARMPSVIEKSRKNENGNTEIVFEAPDANAVCNMRMLRFRREKGMLSWTQKGNTKAIGEGLEKLFGNRLINNSMKSFGRDLKPQEQAEIRKGRDANFAETYHIATTTSATTRPRNGKGTAKTPKQPGHAEGQRTSHQKRPHEDDEDLDSADDQSLVQATAASYRKRLRNARGEAAKPEIDLDDYQDPAAMVNPQDIVKVTSNLMSEETTDFSDEYHDEDGDSSEDDDESDGEYETSKSHRQIHALPARRISGKKATGNPLPDPAPTQEQQGSSADENAESESNEADHDGDDDMTDEDDDRSDGESDREASQASTGDDQEEAIEATEDINIPPPVPQETDLERHRRVTREFLGEEDDYYWLPETPPPWTSTLLFPPRAPE